MILLDKILSKYNVSPGNHATPQGLHANTYRNSFMFLATFNTVPFQVNFIED